MNRIRNPFSEMLIALEPDRFFGRRADLLVLEQGVTARRPCSFAISGVKTIGKSSLLRYMCDERADFERACRRRIANELGPDGDIEFFLIDLYDNTDPLGRMCAELLDSAKIQQLLHRTLSDYGAQCGVDAPEAKKRALQGIFRLCSENKMRLVICLDHFDRAFSEMEYADDEFLRDLALQQALVLATGRSLSELRRDPRRSSPLINLLKLRNIGLLTPAEAHELVSKPADKAGAPFPPALVEFLVDKVGRQPYLLTIACEFMFDLNERAMFVGQRIHDDVRVQEQVLSQLEALPAVVELLTYFWGELNAEERRALKLLSMGAGVENERERGALHGLHQKALITENLEDGRTYLFSELLHRYVQRQTAGRADIPPEEFIESLAPRDRRLFEYLRSRPNEVCFFDDIIKEVWGGERASKQALQAAVFRLKTRLQDLGRADWGRIESIRGKGYQYVVESE